MKTSQKGIDLLKSFEAFKPYCYRCPAGKPTIGYGHVVQPRENFPAVLTLDYAEDLLERDLAQFERSVLALTKGVALTQEQFDALVCFTFNVGMGAFAGSTLLKKLKAGDYVGAADEFLKWDHAGGKVLAGLTRRREAERKLFLGQ